MAVGVHHTGEEQPRVKLGAGHPVGLPLHPGQRTRHRKGSQGGRRLDPPTVKEEAGGYPAQRPEEFIGEDAQFGLFEVDLKLGEALRTT